MKKEELLEIGELVNELIAKGIEFFIENVPDGKWVWWKPSGEIITACCVYGETLTEALNTLVNKIRKLRGEPSRAEEIAAMLEKDSARAGIVGTFGPGSCCPVCQSAANGTLTKSVGFKIEWSSGRIFTDWESLRLLPGDAFQCPDCLTHFQTNAEAETSNKCPQCGEMLVFPRDGEAYCEECGFPNECRPECPTCPDCACGHSADISCEEFFRNKDA